MRQSTTWRLPAHRQAHSPHRDYAPARCMRMGAPQNTDGCTRQRLWEYARSRSKQRRGAERRGGMQTEQCAKDDARTDPARSKGPPRHTGSAAERFHGHMRARRQAPPRAHARSPPARAHLLIPPAVGARAFRPPALNPLTPVPIWDRLPTFNRMEGGDEQQRSPAPMVLEHRAHQRSAAATTTAVALHW